MAKTNLKAIKPKREVQCFHCKKYFLSTVPAALLLMCGACFRLTNWGFLNALRIEGIDQ